MIHSAPRLFGCTFERSAISLKGRTN